MWVFSRLELMGDVVVLEPHFRWLAAFDLRGESGWTEQGDSGRIRGWFRSSLPSNVSIVILV
jgi:hypothetical protein